MQGNPGPVVPGYEEEITVRVKNDLSAFQIRCILGLGIVTLENKWAVGYCFKRPRK